MEPKTTHRNGETAAHFIPKNQVFFHRVEHDRTRSPISAPSANHWIVCPFFNRGEQTVYHRVFTFNRRFSRKSNRCSPFSHAWWPSSNELLLLSPNDSQTAQASVRIGHIPARTTLNRLSHSSFSAFPPSLCAFDDEFCKSRFGT